MEAIRIEYEKEFQKSLDEDVRICLQFCFSYLVAVYAKQVMHIFSELTNLFFDACIFGGTPKMASPKYKTGLEQTLLGE